MHPLDGPRFKIRRAESEIQVLDDKMLAMWSDSVYHIVRAERNPKTGNDIYRVQTNMPPSFLDWGVSIGEIAHNLRSALDGLIHQLALLETNTPARNTQFPIFLQGQTVKLIPGKRKQLIAHFEGKGRANGRSQIQDLRPEHQTLIERLQPYKRGRGGRKNPLFRLKELNNADKHRIITPVAPRLGAGPFISGREESQMRFSFYKGRFYGRILVDGAKFGEADPSVHVGQNLLPLISFGEDVSEVNGLPVVDTLSRIAEHVSEIIESFGPEFS